MNHLRSAPPATAIHNSLYLSQSLEPANSRLQITLLSAPFTELALIFILNA
jgi:hypothetical protein